MNTEVNPELAEILKKKGFDLEVNQFYSDNKIVRLSIASNINGEAPDFTSAPTIGDVVMWLYKKYGIWISCEKIDSYQELFYYNITDSKGGHKITAIEWDDEKCDEMGYNNKYHKSPNEAYEAAFKHVLNNLI